MKTVAVVFISVLLLGMLVTCGDKATHNTPRNRGHVMVSVWGWFHSEVEAAELYGQPIIHTGPFFCAHQQRELRWTNESDATLNVTRVQVWMGMDKDNISDYYATVLRESDNCLMACVNDDHYANRTSIEGNNLKENYSPHWISIPPGETILLIYGCTNIAGDPCANIIVSAWWFGGDKFIHPVTYGGQ